MKSKAITFAASKELFEAIEALALEIDGNISSTVRMIVATYLRERERFDHCEPVLANSTRNHLCARLLAEAEAR